MPWSPWRNSSWPSKSLGAFRRVLVEDRPWGEVHDTVSEGREPLVVGRDHHDPPGCGQVAEVAIFFARRGHQVFRVSSAKSADLRRFLSRHAKSNVIDADTLARLPIFDRDGLVPIEFAEGDHAALDRRVRAADRLRDQASRHKIRIRDLARQTMPMIDDVITGVIGAGDIAVLERYGDPRRMLQAGRSRLAALIAKITRGRHTTARAEACAARRSGRGPALYGDDPAIPFEALAAEIATEARLWRAIEAEYEHHAAQSARPPISASTPTGWPEPCPASRPSARRCWSR